MEIIKLSPSISQKPAVTNQLAEKTLMTQFVSDVDIEFEYLTDVTDETSAYADQDSRVGKAKILTCG